MTWLWLILAGVLLMRDERKELAQFWKKLGEKVKGKPKALYDALNSLDLEDWQKALIYLHARLETGKAFDFPARFNLWGIKFAEWMRKYGVYPRPVPTTEYEGRWVHITDNFAEFQSLHHALSIYLSLNSVRRALKNARTIEEFAHILKRYRYYTAPASNYARLLRRHYEQVRRLLT